MCELSRSNATPSQNVNSAKKSNFWLYPNLVKSLTYAAQSLSFHRTVKFP